jgi:hypothetical protein
MPTARKVLWYEGYLAGSKDNALSDQTTTPGTKMRQIDR